MVKKHLSEFFLLLFILGASGLLAWWFFHDPVKNFNASVPGMDNRRKGAAVVRKPVIIGSEFKFFLSSPDIPGTRWTRFRGQDFDNISKEPDKLIEKWGKNGPKILWTKMLGEGHAAPAVYDGKVYILDYNEEGI
jgi:outer membrane protein assembly factor BamB